MRDLADRDHELARTPLAVRVGLGRVGLVDDDLGDAVPVAEVEEDQRPWSTADGPSRRATPTARVGRPEATRTVGA